MLDEVIRTDRIGGFSQRNSGPCPFVIIPTVVLVSVSSLGIISAGIPQGVNMPVFPHNGPVPPFDAIESDDSYRRSVPRRNGLAKHYQHQRTHVDKSAHTPSERWRLPRGTGPEPRRRGPTARCPSASSTGGARPQVLTAKCLHSTPQSRCAFAP
jgi:hypothetical protein